MNGSRATFRLLTVALGTALASMLLVAGAQSAADAPGTIAFTRADGIYVMRADGTDVRPLRRGGPAAGAIALAWSPDGRRLAFVNQRPNGLWAMDADGTNLVRLVGPAEVSATMIGSVTWLPRGRGLAFTALVPSKNGKGRNWDVWVADPDGTDVRRLRSTSRIWELEVAWSPRGDRIAVTDVGGMVLRLRVTDRDGKLLRRFGDVIDQAAMPSWSPDGRKLAFMRFRNVQGGVSDAELWVTNLSGSLRRLTRNTVVDSNPAWSPDGRKLVFVRDRHASWLWLPPQKRDAGELYVMNADGTAVTRLTENDLAESSPAWQPREAH